MYSFFVFKLLIMLTLLPCSHHSPFPELLWTQNVTHVFFSVPDLLRPTSVWKTSFAGFGPIRSLRQENTKCILLTREDQQISGFSNAIRLQIFNIGFSDSPWNDEPLQDHFSRFSSGFSQTEMLWLRLMSGHIWVARRLYSYPHPTFPRYRRFRSAFRLGKRPKTAKAWYSHLQTRVTMPNNPSTSLSVYPSAQPNLLPSHSLRLTYAPIQSRRYGCRPE